MSKLTVPELCQLFAKFLDAPLTGPGVERIIQVYLPARDEAKFTEMWSHKHLKGKDRTGLSVLDPGQTRAAFFARAEDIAQVG